MQRQKMNERMSMNLGIVRRISEDKPEGRFERKSDIKRLAIVFVAMLIIVAASFAVFAAPGVSAAGGVIEVPKVRIVIDGTAGNYTDVPIEIDDRILLPFREILAKLGVPNDDEHIIWNDEEQSVTVVNGAKTIKLEIGNKVMSVDGVETTFDIAPYFYSKNNRTYIPVRAVSELMDKVVGWEDSNSTVYVRDKANYAETLDLINKIQAVGTQTKMQAVSDSEVLVKISTTPDIPGMPNPLEIGIDVSQLLSADTDENIIRLEQNMNVQGIDVSSDVFIYKDRVFIKSSGLLGSGWSEDKSQTLSEVGGLADQMKMAESSLATGTAESLSMRMSSIKGSNGTYTIVGEPIDNASLEAVMDMVETVMPMDDNMSVDITINKFQVGETIDSAFHTQKSVANLDFSFTLVQKNPDGTSVTITCDATMYMNMTYNDIGEDFTVEIPADLASLL